MPCVIMQNIMQISNQDTWIETLGFEIGTTYKIMSILIFFKGGGEYNIKSSNENLCSDPKWNFVYWYFQLFNQGTETKFVRSKTRRFLVTNYMRYFPFPFNLKQSTSCFSQQNRISNTRVPQLKCLWAKLFFLITKRLLLYIFVF